MRKQRCYLPLYVSLDVHHKVKSMAAAKGKKINDYLGELFSDEEDKGKGGRWRGIF